MASVATLAGLAWMGREELWPVLDGLAAAGVAGLAGWHAGCVVRDGCLGTASDLPWATAQLGSTVTRHPVEIYAAVLLAVAALGIALWRRRRMPPRGIAAGAALATAAGVRLITEPLRPSLDGGPVEWYLAGLIVGASTAIWHWLRVRGNPEPESGR